MIFIYIYHTLICLSTSYKGFSVVTSSEDMAVVDIHMTFIYIYTHPYVADIIQRLPSRDKF